MVSIWRPGLHPRGLGYGVVDGSRSGLPILRSRAKEIGIVIDVGLHGRRLNSQLSVVLLGILSDFLTHRTKRFHWRPRTFWVEENFGESQPRLAFDPQFVVRLLSGILVLVLCLHIQLKSPDAILRCHSGHHNWSDCRARETYAVSASTP